ncbi:hypothetical protein [Bacillus pumilus]
MQMNFLYIDSTILFKIEKAVENVQCNSLIDELARNSIGQRFAA